MPGYVSRYDDLDGGEFDAIPSVARYETAAPAARARPPLRRGPLRGHTQHARAGQSVLRGPHASPRRDVPPRASCRPRRVDGKFGSGL
jgi:stage V sporulation protein G